jgi:carbamate kinase
MRIVIALGGSAILPRGEPVTGDNLQEGMRLLAGPLAALGTRHQLVICHGRGPQISLLTLQAAAPPTVETRTPDSIMADAEGLMSYLLEQELGNLLPPGRPVATILTRAEIDPADPALKRPTTFVGPLYLQEEAADLASKRGWVFRPFGDKWRRVVGCPEPRRIVEVLPITWLLEHHAVVIAEGGGGIPVMSRRKGGSWFTTVEGVIDSDLAAALLATEVAADVFVLLTKADAVYVDWGLPEQRSIRRASAPVLNALPLPSHSIGGKVRAACRFTLATGRDAIIGTVADLPRLLTGEAGTTVSATMDGVSFGTDGPLNVSTFRRRPAHRPPA